MKAASTVALPFVLFVAVFSAAHSQVIVNVTQGLLSGGQNLDRKNNLFYSFLRIPYASPPIGTLRFRDPQPPASWTGIRPATEDLPFCVQTTINGTLHGQEDCLYLNVYTPQLPNVNVPQLPVMVFIHGGGFVDGSGRKDYYSPEYLMPENIVLVTLNYRLNIFGFFSLDNPAMRTPGNAGLKDQTMALRWVRENIAQFHGNPDNVTIFGESAGGASVHYHVLSPLSRGLFSKAILQSGTAISPWNNGFRNNGVAIASHLGMDTTNIEAMLCQLQHMPIAQLYHGYQLLNANVSMNWGTVVHPIVEHQDDSAAFITQDPFVIISSGDYTDVPMMIGYTDAEGIAVDQFVRAVLGHSVLISDFFNLVPYEIEVRNAQEREQLTHRIRTFYYGTTTPSLADMRPFVQIYTDSWFGFPAFRAAREHARVANSSIYLYRFSADTLLNIYKRRDNISAAFEGASHCDELGYLYRSYLTPYIEPHSAEDRAIDRIVRIWADFARYGNPNGPGNAHQWLPVANETMNYADIGTLITQSSVDPDPENMALWADIYEQYFTGGSPCLVKLSAVLIFMLCMLNLVVV